MRDLQQLLYPWVQYKCVKMFNTEVTVYEVCSTYELEENLIDPFFIDPIKKVILWSGDSFFRFYEMIFGRFGVGVLTNFRLCRIYVLHRPFNKMDKNRRKLDISVGDTFQGRFKPKNKLLN